MNDKLTYGEIRKKYGAKYGRGSVFVDAYVCLISPIFTKIAVRYKLLPNTMTIGMILSGIIGAFFFGTPYLTCKIIGIIFIHLWFVLDCSDGEVARATKTFSKWGKELDYMAHTFNHPLFAMSFFISIYLDGHLLKGTILLFGLLILSDGILRMIYIFHYLEKIKEGNENNSREETNSTWRELVIFVINIFAQFPNFALIYPIVYIISAKAGYFYLIVDTFIATLYSLYAMIKWIRGIHRI